MTLASEQQHVYDLLEAQLQERINKKVLEHQLKTNVSMTFKHDQIPIEIEEAKKRFVNILKGKVEVEEEEKEIERYLDF